MKTNITPKQMIAVASSFVLFGIAMLVAGVFVGAAATHNGTSELPLQLRADTASNGKNISMATARVDETVEAIYVLDHLNGNLNCWVLNARSGKVGAVYTANVIEAMPGVKIGDLDLVLTTGFVDFTNRGTLPPARSVAYVAEGKSGKLVGYSFTFNQAAIQRNVVQKGDLKVIFESPIRELQLRDQ